MHICIVINALIPAYLYGGTERVVVWLGRGLSEMGHKVSYLAAEGSSLDFAPVHILDPRKRIDDQLPDGVDIVHMHSELEFPQSKPFCLTIHGNANQAREFNKNTIFCSQKHAHNHGAQAFVHLGLDPREYGAPNFHVNTNARLIFLGKAAWKLKNVKGAIEVAKKSASEIDILGGTRLNFKMGFRLTLDWAAHFHGMVGGAEKYALMRSAKGLLFPVLWDEPGATAVVESLYFGLPVLATPYGCLTEQVPPFAGLLSNKASDLAEAAKNIQQFDRQAIHQHWQQNFTYVHMAKKYMGYYEQILSGESLHRETIQSPPVRTKKLFDWFS
jgi:glycosyltransferase involved in cell wall biosynthesis